MSSGALICDGEVTIAADGAPLCSGVWHLMAVPEPFDPSQLPLADLLAMFSYGFGLVAVCCVVGIAGRLLLNAIYNPNSE
mgnify:CR=1 FL=1